MTFSCEPLHMHESELADQQELYSSSALTQDAVQKTRQEQWIMGMDGEKERVKEIRLVCLDFMAYQPL